MVEEIRNRLIQGYTMSIYGTRELLHEQMEEDISFLLILFDALKQSKKQIIIGFATWLKQNDTIENAEQWFGFSDEDMLDYYLENILKYKI